MKKSHYQLLYAVLLVGLFCVSLKSLCTFPDPFEDEGIYAAQGYEFVSTGIFNSKTETDHEPFAKGDPVHSRMAATVFGVLAQTFGPYLAVARTVSFLFVWAATIFWFFIGRRFGVSGLLSALIFASSERVFYASHVFRPEATTIFMNSLLLFLIVRWDALKLSSSLSLRRGLLNALFVLGHVNGLVTAVLNTLEFVARGLRNARRFLPNAAWYFLGGLLGILAVYLLQIRPGGGWDAAYRQTEFWGAWHTRSIYESIHDDLKARWGRELVVVGNSLTAKILRAGFYAIMIGVAAYSFACLKGLARTLGALSLGCVLGYMFLIQDKIDIHIAEMIPFFLASFFAWRQAMSEKKRWRRAAELTTQVVLCIGLVLCFHHGFKYSGNAPSKIRDISAQVTSYIKTSTKYQPADFTYIGELCYWFYFNQAGTFYARRYIAYHLPLKGPVVDFEARGGPVHEFLKTCRLDYTAPFKDFTVYNCP